MAFGGTLWMLILYMIIFIHFLLFARGVYYHFTRTHIPPGITHGRKLLFYSFAMGYFLELGVFLEKLGICHRYFILRTVYDAIPTRKDSKLIRKDLVFDGVPVRVYWPKTSPAGNRRGIIFLHGGAGLIGSIQASEKVCCSFVHESDSVVVSVGFRLAPEHPYPVPVLDCLTATIHFLKNAKEYGVDPNCIAIVGESSGGTFAAAVCQELVTRRDLPRLQAQVLINPFLQTGDFDLPSYQQNQSVPPLFRKRTIKFGVRHLTGKDMNVDTVIKGAHVPPDLREKYRKWISADNIAEEFKARGYVPHAPALFSEELYEQVKRGGETMFAPLVAEDDIIRQLPETFIQTSEYDVLRDDGLLYKKRLEDNGVPVTYHHLSDACHATIAYLGWGPLEFPSSKKSLQDVVQFLKGLYK
ncbi:arylacetamide deacetylase-like 4 [Zootoca vivipara]|uniref:arylacetamide deacetylase-like 4 n=1 Tax=Zootoca vivipara TaxID=8524 RepID=UPI00293BCB8A|nr:arylacetamide deacetylase-like 4 [Zootoca vivipara]XP_060125951.1 arylacetamide deacetylase-like 4 [Zootoca vivipara]XP_060125952.1 arylacetamide deacetylase-like 4 [Zootoca vivipara]XP_060125953.1 arylacetamide deacetylase-like 4 [Zootoca vivipara]